MVVLDKWDNVKLEKSSLLATEAIEFILQFYMIFHCSFCHKSVVLFFPLFPSHHCISFFFVLHLSVYSVFIFIFTLLDFCFY